MIDWSKTQDGQVSGRRPHLNRSHQPRITHYRPRIKVTGPTSAHCGQYNENNISSSSSLHLFIIVNCFVADVGSGNYNEDLSELFSRLWDNDINRCRPDIDYSLDLQGIIVMLLLCIKLFI